jgi:hypothetical protein
VFEGSTSANSTRAGDSSSESWKSVIWPKYASERRRASRPPCGAARSLRTAYGSPGPMRRNLKPCFGSSPVTVWSSVVSPVSRSSGVWVAWPPALAAPPSARAIVARPAAPARNPVLTR